MKALKLFLACLLFGQILFGMQNEHTVHKTKFCRSLALPKDLQLKILENIMINNKILYSEPILKIDGHKNRVTCLTSISGHKDKVIASGSADNTISIWVLPSGKRLFELEGHTKTIRCLIDLGNGLIASGSSDNTIRVWNINNGSCLYVLEASVFSLVNLSGELDLAPENKVIASASYDSIKIWDLNTHRYTNIIVDHGNYIYCLAKVYNDTKASEAFIAFGGTDCKVKIFNLLTGQYLHVLDGHKNTVTRLASLGNNKIASGSLDGKIKIWDIVTGKCILTLNSSEKPISSLVSLNKNRIASGSCDNTVKIWDTLTGECLNSIIGYSGCLVNSKDANILATGSSSVVNDLENCHIYIWNTNKLELAKLSRAIRIYFSSIENPIALWMCMFDDPLSCNELAAILSLFKDDNKKINRSKLNKWIDSIHKDFKESVRVKFNILKLEENCLLS